MLNSGYAVDGWINGKTDEVVDILYISTPSGVQEFSEMSIVDVAIELFAENGIKAENKMACAVNQLTGAAKIYGRLCQILG